MAVRRQADKVDITCIYCLNNIVGVNKNGGFPMVVADDLVPNCILRNLFLLGGIKIALK